MHSNLFFDSKIRGLDPGLPFQLIRLSIYHAKIDPRPDQTFFFHQFDFVIGKKKTKAQRLFFILEIEENRVTGPIWPQAENPAFQVKTTKGQLI